MGRNIPPHTNASDHPAIAFSAFAACLAATVLIVAALCGVRSRFRKQKPSQSTPDVKQDKNNIEATTATYTKSPPESPSRSPPVSVSPSPPPPPTTIAAIEAERTKDVQQLEKEFPQRKLTIKTPRRSLSTSISTKMGGTSLARILSRREDSQQPKQKKLKHEDSIWTKTIMLGERCRVPDEDDAIIYDEKGNRVSAYRVRTPRSVPISRSNSFVDKDPLPEQ